MARHVRNVTIDDIDRGFRALGMLHDAAGLLRMAGMRRAAAYVQRAVKSVRGAIAHAEGIRDRQYRQDEARRESPVCAIAPAIIRCRSCGKPADESAMCDQCAGEV